MYFKPLSKKNLPGSNDAVLAAPNQLKFNNQINERQIAVRNAFKHAWKGYKVFLFNKILKF